MLALFVRPDEDWGDDDDTKQRRWPCGSMKLRNRNEKKKLLILSWFFTVRGCSRSLSRCDSETGQQRNGGMVSMDVMAE